MKFILSSSLKYDIQDMIDDWKTSAEKRLCTRISADTVRSMQSPEGTHVAHPRCNSSGHSPPEMVLVSLRALVPPEASPTPAVPMPAHVPAGSGIIGEARAARSSPGG